MKNLLTIILLMMTLVTGFAQDGTSRKIPEKSDILVADTTCLYAVKDNERLYLDIYYPAEGSETTFNGKEKPVILYIFGGGYAVGERDAVLQLRWYKKLIGEGFRVVAIDYRLGLKDILKGKVKKSHILQDMEHAMDISIEDLYTATGYLIEHGEELGIDPYNMVISGSSAGAVNSLEADYQLCNRDRYDIDLPDDFRYKGIISFSGGVFSREGKPEYRTAKPAPTLLLHGIDDRIVHYKQLRFFNVGFFGSDKLAKILAKYDTSYNIMRYKDCGHEVAASFSPTLDEQLAFIYTNVMEGKHKIVDSVLDDPGIDKRFQFKKLREVYALQNGQYAE